jgi:hypothetical protein
MLSRMRAKADIWAERVRGWKASGLSAEEFTEGKEFTGRMLRWWAGEFLRRTKAKAKAGAPIAMARVVAPGEVIADERATSGSVAVVVGRYHVTLSRGFDESLLRDVLRVLAEPQ